VPFQTVEFEGHILWQQNGRNDSLSLAPIFVAILWALFPQRGHANSPLLQRPSELNFNQPIVAPLCPPLAIPVNHWKSLEDYSQSLAQAACSVPQSTVDPKDLEARFSRNFPNAEKVTLGRIIHPTISGEFRGSQSDFDLVKKFIGADILNQSPTTLSIMRRASSTCQPPDTRKLPHINCLVENSLALVFNGQRGISTQISDEEAEMAKLASQRVLSLARERGFIISLSQESNGGGENVFWNYSQIQQIDDHFLTLPVNHRSDHHLESIFLRHDKNKFLNDASTAGAIHAHLSPTDQDWGSADYGISIRLNPDDPYEFLSIYIYHELGHHMQGEVGGIATQIGEHNGFLKVQVKSFDAEGRKIMIDNDTPGKTFYENSKGEVFYMDGGKLLPAIREDNMPVGTLRQKTHLAYTFSPEAQFLNEAASRHPEEDYAISRHAYVDLPSYFKAVAPIKYGLFREHVFSQKEFLETTTSWPDFDQHYPPNTAAGRGKLLNECLNNISEVKMNAHFKITTAGIEDNFWEFSMYNECLNESVRTFPNINSMTYCRIGQVKGARRYARDQVAPMIMPLLQLTKEYLELLKTAGTSKSLSIYIREKISNNPKEYPSLAELSEAVISSALDRLKQITILSN